MIEESKKSIPWVIARLERELYGVPSDVVREMVRVSLVTSVPKMPEYVRGVINLRGNIIPLIDLRVLLGMRSAHHETDELIENLLKREKDHHDWLDNLTRSVKEHVPFTGALDPHQCAFGRWYDTFKTDNLLLNAMLRRFDRPHKAIHAIGAKVKVLEEQKNFDGAMSLIDRTRNVELAELTELFAATRDLLRNDSREIAIVLKNDERVVAITVDAIESVEKLNEESFADPPLRNMTIGNQLICATSRRARTDDLALLLDAQKVLSDAVDGGAPTMEQAPEAAVA